ncbi:hypothetical protein MMC21_001210 [Puttea exsequens]|nr:hypothetical protein [Puttea exsequens]
MAPLTFTLLTVLVYTSTISALQPQRRHFHHSSAADTGVPHHSIAADAPFPLSNHTLLSGGPTGIGSDSGAAHPTGTGISTQAIFFTAAPDILPSATKGSGPDYPVVPGAAAPSVPGGSRSGVGSESGSQSISGSGSGLGSSGVGSGLGSVSALKSTSNSGSISGSTKSGASSGSSSDSSSVSSPVLGLGSGSAQGEADATCPPPVTVTSMIQVAVIVTVPASTAAAAAVDTAGGARDGAAPYPIPGQGNMMPSGMGNAFVPIITAASTGLAPLPTGHLKFQKIYEVRGLEQVREEKKGSAF